MTDNDSDDSRRVDASKIELVVDGDSNPIPITDASVDMKETDREGIGSMEDVNKTYSGSFTINCGISDELREAMENTLLTVAQTILPELAENQPGWPVKYDHCFLRICYDNAVEGVWYDHVDGRPAYESMTDWQLFKATQIALSMMNGPPKVCRVLNQRSLDWRE